MLEVWWAPPDQDPLPFVLDKLAGARRPLYLAAGLPLLRRSVRALAARPDATSRRERSFVFARFLERTFTSACRDWRRIDPAEHRMVLGHLLRTLPLPRIAPIADRPGLMRAASRLVKELKETAVPPSRWPEFLTAGKEPDFATLAVAYQQYLSSHRLADREDVFRMAAEHLSVTGPVEGFDLAVVQGFATFTGLERRALAALATHLPVLLIVTYDPRRPEVFAPTVGDLGDWWAGAQPIPAGGRPAAPDIAHLQAEMFRPEPDVMTSLQAVSALVASDPDREVLEIARTVKELVLAGDWQPEDVAVVTNDPEGYRERVRTTFARYGIPVELPPEPLVAAPVVQAVLSLLRLAAAPWHAHDLLDVAKSPYLGCPSELASWLDQAVAVLPPLAHPAEWVAVLGALPPVGPRDLAIQWVAELAGVLAPMDREVPAAEHCAALARGLAEWQIEERILDLMHRWPLGGEVAAHSARELAAFRSLLRVLVRLESAYRKLEQAPRLGPAEFHALLAAELAQATLPAQQPARGAAVRFLVPAQAEGLRIPVVFLAGLVEGVFPASQRDDWIMSDRRRRALAPNLPLVTWERHQAVQRLQFLRAVRAATTSLWLSRSSSGADGSAWLPSAYWEEAISCFGGQVPMVQVSLTEVATASIGRVLCREELLASMVQVAWVPGADAAELPALLALHHSGLPAAAAEAWPDLAARIAAEEGRLSHRYSAWDGRLADVATVAKLASRYGPASLFSASELEVYAACPFRFFGERFLRLKGAEEYEADLSPLEQGEGLHRILARFCREWGARPLTDAAAGLLDAIVDQVVAESSDRLAPALRAARRRQWQQRGRAWLGAELVAQERTGGAFRPKYLEWSFGRAPLEGQDPASTDRPLTVASGGREYRFAGVIDRIDVNHAGDLVVYDYKVGASPAAADILDRRVRLQVPLYLLAVARLAPEGARRPVGGAYYSLRDLKRSGGIWRASVRELPGLSRGRALMDDAGFDATLQQLEEHVVDLIENLRQGDLSVNPRVQCPSYCVMRFACRFDPDRLAGKAGRAGEEVAT